MLRGFGQLFLGNRRPFYEMTISGHSDKLQVTTISQEVIQRRPGCDRRQQSLGSTPATHVEALSIIQFLKDRGDAYLPEGFYSNAYMFYDYSMTFEEYWSAHDPQPQIEIFWTEGHDVRKTLGISLACNLAIAHTAGALDASCRGSRGVSMHVFGLELERMSEAGHLLGQERYWELLFAAMVYHVTGRYAQSTLELGVNKQSLILFLHMMLMPWELQHDAKCRHEGSTITGKVYSYAKLILAALADTTDNQVPYQEMETETLSEKNVRRKKAIRDYKDKAVEIVKMLHDIRALMKGATIEPLKWAIHEDMIPKRLHAHLTWLPTVEIHRTHLTRTSAYTLTFARFRKLSKEEYDEGETGIRHMI